MKANIVDGAITPTGSFDLNLHPTNKLNIEY